MSKPLPPRRNPRPRRESEPQRQVTREAHAQRDPNEGVKYPNNYAGGWTGIGNHWPPGRERGKWFPGIT